MNNQYRSLWLLLAVAFVLVAASSLLGPVTISIPSGSFSLADCGLRDSLFPPSSSPTLPHAAPEDSILQISCQTDAPIPLPSACSSVDSSASVSDSHSGPLPRLVGGLSKVASRDASYKSPYPKALPHDTARGRRVLLFGDSMLDGISPRFAAYAKQNGHSLFTVIWYGSSTKLWGTTNRLQYYINRLHPDFIFLCLGSNELFLRNIKKTHRQFVQNIVSDLGSIPYLWIGPPNWRNDTGINSLIGECCAPGCFFLSKDLNFERRKDGCHPTMASAALWVDSVAAWMPSNAAFKIRLQRPDSLSLSAKPTIIYTHNLDDPVE